MQTVIAFIVGLGLIWVTTATPVAQYEEAPLIPAATGTAIVVQTAIVAPDANVTDATAPEITDDDSP